MKRSVLSFALFASILALPGFVSPSQAVPLKPIAIVRHEPIAEMSGIVKSRRWPDTYWVHNDSGDEPRIFAIRGDGSVIVPPWLVAQPSEAVPKPAPFAGLRIQPAANNDWEDIAYDGERLYIADVGNNGNARRDLGVYVVMEPNPIAVDAARPLKWLPIAYPDQREFPPSKRHFDCEAVFVFRGRLHFLTKHRRPDGNTPEPGTYVYRLDSEHTDRLNVLKKLDGHADLGGWITAADVSPDGKTLAVLTHFPVASVWLFDIAGSADKLLQKPKSRFVMTGVQQCEAICFDSPSAVLVTNEQREIFRIALTDFKAVTP